MKTKNRKRLKKNSLYVIHSLLLMILFTLMSNVHAETNHISFDCCSFKIENETKTNLEIYCQFPHSQFTFYKNDSGYTAETEINVVLYDEEGEFVDDIFVKRYIHEINYDRTINSEINTLVQFNFDVEPGKYHIRVRIEDQNSGNILEVEKYAIARSFQQNDLGLSDIEVASSAEPSNEKSNFVKNGRKIIANPTHNFHNEKNLVHFYFEIYNLTIHDENEKNTFQFDYKVKNSAGLVVRKYCHSYLKPYHSTSIDFPIPTKKIDSDTYTLEVRIRDEDTGKEAESLTTFSLIKSPLDIQYENFEEVIAKLKMIADKGELTEIKKVAMGNRKQALQHFWNLKDPSPGTAENELMIEFYNRIDYANKHFSTKQLQGWRTDRGKIFIKHGKPDRISRSMPVTSWIRYERWEYWSKSRNYTFVDRFGFGNYTLVNQILY